MGLKISSDEKASWLLSIIGISSTLGRLIFGFISDHQFINRLWLYNISLTFCGLVTILSSFGKTYWFMALYCASFGLSCGKNSNCKVINNDFNEFHRNLCQLDFRNFS